MVACVPNEPKGAALAWDPNVGAGVVPKPPMEEDAELPKAGVLPKRPDVGAGWVEPKSDVDVEPKGVGFAAPPNKLDVGAGDGAD